MSITRVKRCVSSGLLSTYRDEMQIENIENVYTNTDSTTYAVITRKLGTGSNTRNIKITVVLFYITNIPKKADPSLTAMGAKIKLGGENFNAPFVIISLSTYTQNLKTGAWTAGRPQLYQQVTLTKEPQIITLTDHDHIRYTGFANAENRSTENVLYTTAITVDIPQFREESSTLYYYGVEIPVYYTLPTTLYFKSNESWIDCDKAYRKENGVWVQQSDITNVFQPNINYKYGGG